MEVCCYLLLGEERKLLLIPNHSYAQILDFSVVSYQQLSLPSPRKKNEGLKRNQEWAGGMCLPFSLLRAVELKLTLKIERKKIDNARQGWPKVICPTQKCSMEQGAALPCFLASPINGGGDDLDEDPGTQKRMQAHLLWKISKAALCTISASE